MTSGDVVRALQEQNVQVSGGASGAAGARRQRLPAHGHDPGPLRDAAAVRQCHRQVGSDGRLIRLRDVARVELGAQDYVTNSYLNGKPAVALAIFQRPGTNALAAADRSSTRWRS